MKSDEVSRRFVVGALGIGAATAAAGAAIGMIDAPARASTARSASGGPEEPAIADEQALAEARTLLAPLAPGDRLDRWTVERILPVEDGAASVVLSDESGQRFQLDICKRDTAASSPAGPGRSQHFEVFLANSGDGSKATFEDHGLAAMALAEVIRTNEQGIDRTPFSTQARRAAKARVYVT